MVEINTVDKANEIGHPMTSAKQIMQDFYPGVPDDELVKKSGLTIADSLKDYQTKYQVTADVEDRALNFNEVKKEIDNGQVIQMDVENTSPKDPSDPDEDTGHSMAIVGYVSDSNPSHIPYYEIWNPWWKKTFYLSSQTSTILLGGQEYKWNRTWHNWRKTTAGTHLSLSNDIGKQKVASTSNPQAIASSVQGEELENPFIAPFDPAPLNQLNNFFKSFKTPTNDLMSGFVYEMGAPIYAKDTHGNTFGYSLSLDSTRLIAYKNATPKKSKYNGTAKTFKTSVDQINQYMAKIVAWGFMACVATIAAIIAIAAAPVAVIADAICAIAGGGGITWAEAITLGDNIVHLNTAQNNAKNCFNQL